MINKGSVLSEELAIQGLVVTALSVLGGCQRLVVALLFFEPFLFFLLQFFHFHLVWSQLVDGFLDSELLLILEVIARTKPLELSLAIKLVLWRRIGRRVRTTSLSVFIESWLFWASVLILRVSQSVGAEAATSAVTLAPGDTSTTRSRLLRLNGQPLPVLQRLHLLLVLLITNHNRRELIRLLRIMLLNLRMKQMHDLPELVIEPSLSLRPQLYLAQRTFLFAARWKIHRSVKGSQLSCCEVLLTISECSCRCSPCRRSAGNAWSPLVLLRSLCRWSRQTLLWSALSPARRAGPGQASWAVLESLYAGRLPRSCELFLGSGRAWDRRRWCPRVDGNSSQGVNFGVIVEQSESCEILD